jgi:hypothetical protein
MNYIHIRSDKTFESPTSTYRHFSTLVVKLLLSTLIFENYTVMETT